MSKGKKRVLSLAGGLLALLLAALIALGLLFHREFSTLTSIRKLDDAPFMSWTTPLTTVWKSF